MTKNYVSQAKLAKEAGVTGTTLRTNIRMLQNMLEIRGEKNNG